MKRQVQSIGVRKWFGDDFLSIQNELLAVLEGFFGGYNHQFILSGCEVNGSDISAGIVGLIGADGFHLCRFDGVQGAAWPVYFYPEKIIGNRIYIDLQAKPISETWQAQVSNTDEGAYFRIMTDGSSPRFTDVIQNTNRRFVTDMEKTSYSSQAVSAISTLRDGVAAEFDSLAKLANAIQQLDNYGITSELALKLNTNFDNLADAAAARLALGLSTVVFENDVRLSNERTPLDGSVVRSKLEAGLTEWVEMSAANIDWSAGVDFEKTIGSDTTFTDTNLVKGKVIVLHLDGDFVPTLPSYWKKMGGSEDYYGTVTNRIVAQCTNSTVGSECVEYMINMQD